MNWTRLRVFLLTLLLIGSFALLVKVVRIGHRVDSWKASMSASIAAKPASKPAKYEARCVALGGVAVRLHAAKDNVVYDELCLVPNP